MVGSDFSARSGVFAVSLIATLLTACAELPAGSEAAFDRGRVDGCNSGLSDANKPGYDTRYTKNETRYAADADYRDGWDGGYDTCYWREYHYPTWESGHGGM